MKILFVARHYTYFRNYDSALKDLAARGHQIHLAVEKSESKGGEPAVEALARAHASITYGEIPDRGDSPEADLARRLRLGLDYLRYLDPFYDDAPLRRVRARERTPRGLIQLADPPLVGGDAWRRRVGRWLHALDLAIAPPPVIVSYLQEHAPDVLLITPLVDLGSQQIDFVRAARQLGIPTALAVWSWDHLSSKAYIRECPERVFVWNDTQRREAVEVHRVPADRVVVTGAQCFDHWFERRPSRSRAEFLGGLGLPVDRRMILYVCTGLIMGSPPEPPFVREWLTRVRASVDPAVAGAGVLVRPHPGQTDVWRGVDLDDLGPVAIWGGNPVDDQTRADYFDSLYHSEAVVGLNTSAFIEAGIVGREVLAILPPQYHDNQAGTVHFRYLLEIGGGLLRVSHDFDAHIRQLEGALARTPSAEHPHRAFLESFVRPQGIGNPATPAFVEAVESLRACPIDEADRQPTAAAARALLAPVTRIAGWRLCELAVFSPREAESMQRRRADGAVKAERRARNEVLAQARREAREQRRAEAEADRVARIQSKQQHRQQKGALVEQRRAEKLHQLAEHGSRKQQAAVAQKAAKRWRQRRQLLRARVQRALRVVAGNADSR
jgi:hypothetical protein